MRRSGEVSAFRCSHACLHLDSTAKRIHYTTELYEEAVTRRLYKPAVMRGDGWLKLLDPYSLEGLKSTILVHPDQARVAGHISGENGGQPAFEAFRGQSGAPEPHGPIRLSALEAHSNGKSEGGHSLSVERPISDRG